MPTLEEGQGLELRVRAITDTLPEGSFLRNYVWYGSNLTDANAICHLAAGLALLTQTAPDDLSTRLGPRIPSNLYTLVAGSSTETRKTSAVNMAREIMNEALPGRIGEAPGSDEGLQESLGVQPRQLYVYEEFGHFLQSAQHGYQSKIKTSFANLYDGSPAGHRLVSKGKNGKERFPVQKPRLSLLCACASDYLSRYTEPVDWTGGFFARFLTFLAPRARSYVLTPRDNSQFRAWILKRLYDLDSIKIVPGECMGLTADAAAYWQEWSSWRDTIAAQYATSKTAGAIGRSQAFALKIALLLSWEAQIVTPAPWSIQLEQIKPAVEIVGLHLQSVLQLGETIGGTPDMNDRQAVLRTLDDGPKTVGQIQKKAFLLKHRVLQLLDSLMEEEAIQRRNALDDASGLRKDFYERGAPTPGG